MSCSRDLLRAVTTLSSEYTDDVKELKNCKKKLRRVECIIRDLRVEIQYLAEQMQSTMDTSSSQHPTTDTPPSYSESTPR